MKVKICGNNTVESATTAQNSGADFLGFIFFENSPRNISYAQAKEIASTLKPGTTKVAITVNPMDEEISQIKSHLNPEYIQLHGSESPERALEIKNKFGLKIIKAISISEEKDLEAAIPFQNVADYILFDAKPPKGANRPGGNASSFDWNILKTFKPTYNYILAGGLDGDNVEEAIAITGTNFVDVVSGVESSPGVKDLQKIKDFISKAKS